MADVIIEGGEHRYGTNGTSGTNGKHMDLAEITTRGRELAEKARDWVVANPIAALGIAVGTGFLFGRAVRMWALR
jgi:ElaB/YqjD/DUF883 family membrane-anchored ribosome-binding protein